MAWSIETYESAFAAGSPSNWRLAMFELIRACHQRSDAMGIVRRQFYNASGDLTIADLSMEDLEGMHFYSDNGLTRYFYFNITKLASFLYLTVYDPDLADNSIGAPFYYPKFTTGPGNTDYWTFETINDAVGFPLLKNPAYEQFPISGPTDAAYFQALQDAFGLLKTFTAVRPISVSATNGTYYHSTTNYSTSQLAWNNRRVASAATTTDELKRTAAWDVNKVGSFSLYNSGVYIPTTTLGLRMSAGSPAGFSSDVEIVGGAFEASSAWNDSPSVDFVATIGSNSLSIPTNTLFTEGGWHEWDVVEVVPGTTVNLAYTAPTEPSTVPFDTSVPSPSGLGLTANNYNAGLVVGDFRVYGDATSLLTDQE